MNIIHSLNQKGEKAQNLDIESKRILNAFSLCEGMNNVLKPSPVTITTMWGGVCIICWRIKYVWNDVNVAGGKRWEGNQSGYEAFRSYIDHTYE